ncbi:hypothetical protein LXL04_025437 [Taraxacum kok-saghyz]
MSDYKYQKINYDIHYHFKSESRNLYYQHDYGYDYIKEKKKGEEQNSNLKDYAEIESKYGIAIGIWGKSVKLRITWASILGFSKFSWINGSHAPIISESVPSSRHPEGQSRTHRGSREKFHHTGASREGFTTSIDHLLGTSTPSWVIKTRCITLSRRFEHWTSQRETSALAS